LAEISGKDQINRALRVYEQARKSRAETIQQLGSEHRITLHLPDGPEQVARDQKFKLVSASGDNPDRWGDTTIQKLLWDWDSEQSARETWQGNVSCSRILTYISFSAASKLDLLSKI
jgi:salicylate hydroxylase